MFRLSSRSLCTLLVASALSAACSESQKITEVPPSLPPNLGDRIPLAQWSPLPAASAAAVSPEVQAARVELLGQNPTDPAYVKLWWTGVSSFVVAAGGHLFLLDAWEVVGVHQNYVPITRDDLARLKPEAILIGHGHFDHAADAGYVAARSGAVVVGSEEICDQAKSDAESEGLADQFKCLITGTMDVPIPGVVQSVKLWTDMPEIQVLQHLHSAFTPEDPGQPGLWIPNVLPFILNLNLDPEELSRFISHLADDQGGAWAYHVRSGNFSLFWHDSSGPINDGNPYAAQIQQALESLPDCVDVQISAITGFDQPVSGLRDPSIYVKHAHPKVSLPSHHDAWLPVLGGGASAYKSQWLEAVEALENPPEIDYLTDPADYLQPRSYRIDDPRWSLPMTGSSCERS